MAGDGRRKFFQKKRGSGIYIEGEGGLGVRNVRDTTQVVLRHEFTVKGSDETKTATAQTVTLSWAVRS
jgi:hypothetical protein